MRLALVCTVTFHPGRTSSCVGAKHPTQVAFIARFSQCCVAASCSRREGSSSLPATSRMRSTSKGDCALANIILAETGLWGVANKLVGSPSSRSLHRAQVCSFESHASGPTRHTLLTRPLQKSAFIARPSSSRDDHRELLIVITGGPFGGFKHWWLASQTQRLLSSTRCESK